MPLNPLGFQMTADQEAADRKNKPQDVIKPKMSPRRDLLAVNPDAPGVMQAMKHEIPGTYEDI